MKRLLPLAAVLILVALSIFMTQSSTAPTEKEEVPASPALVSQPIEPSIVIKPEVILQGDPVLISLEGVGSLAEIESFRFDGKEAKVFMYEGRPSTMVGIDLRGRVGAYPIEITLTNSEKISKNLAVGERTIVKAPLGIPDKLGGNTPEAEKELVNTLVQEGAIISAVPSGPTKLWSEPFRPPVEAPMITSIYGYSRVTGASTLAHKGTDYRAAVGTPIYAMNSGVVRFNSFLRNYGNTVIIDHGLGLHTIYMHLSRSDVALGQRVSKGEAIGASGDTGYVIGPHLHLTVRVNGISIDPEKFLALFGG